MGNWLNSLLSRRAAPESGHNSPNSLRSLFHKFRRILELNNAAMEKMAELERALGGEFIFDNAFLFKSVRELSRDVHQIVYNLNAMSSDAYVDLYDRFEYLTGVLEDILSGGLGPYSSRLALGYPEIYWESLPLVGVSNVCLAELLRLPETGAVDGFVLTVTGCSRIKEDSTITPAAVEQALLRETSALFERLGGSCPLVITACPAGDLDPDPEIIGVERESNLENIVRDVTLACWSAWSENADVKFAVGVREAVRGAHAGLLSTLDRKAPVPEAMSLVLEGEHEEERYYLHRAHPFAAVISEISPKDENRRLPDGKRSLSATDKGMLRGSALIAGHQQKRLAEAGMVIERALGAPQELSWRLDAGGIPRILDVRSVRTQDEGDLSEAVAEALSHSETLVSGGESAQAGISAGAVVHVKETDNPENFPLGAVAVARTASPLLTPFLLRAGALITEVGSAIGHLATVAREYRVPAVFGARHALKILEPGAEVTVDASVPAVYAGVIPSLLAQSRAGSEFFATDPEYTTLRRLLQFILPLRLTDPDSPAFVPENCRSFHDVIHYAHEQSVAELLNTRHHEDASVADPHRLEDHAPLNLALVDAGGGLPDDAGPVVPCKRVLSEPLRCILAGLIYAWDNRQGVHVSFRNIFSGMQRTGSILHAPPEYAGRNLAVVASGYCNLSLHMGYHFNVIDAFMSDAPSQNYIYFRFAGGFADRAGKNRRCELLRRVLAGMQFNVAVKGDLVTARLKIVEREDMARVLEHLGLLAGFTRQLDIAMGDAQSPDVYQEAFVQFAETYDRRRDLNGHAGALS